jgi:hypothetical protein
MAQPAGTLGTKLFISQVAAATTDDTEIEYQARNYSEVGYVENFGEFGKQFDLVTFQAVGDGRTYKLKGGYNSGQIQLVVGTDLSDAGQILLATAADASNQDVYNFQIELNNSDTVYGAGTMYYFQAKVMSFRDNIGAVNNAIRATVSLEITSDLLTLPVGELFDRYNSNTDSLAHYNLFHGSDDLAASPAINNGVLVFTSGNAGTGFAADGSEAVGGASDLVFTTAGGTNLIFDVSIRPGSLVSAMFVGFTDNNASLEMPIEAPAGSLVTNATDAVGIIFDNGYGNARYRLVGVNNNVDETVQDSGILAVAGGANIALRIEVNAAGDATFYRNGVAIGSTMTTALRTNISIYPVIAWVTRDANTHNLQVDKLYVRQD